MAVRTFLAVDAISLCSVRACGNGREGRVEGDTSVGGGREYLHYWTCVSRGGRRVV